MVSQREGVAHLEIGQPDGLPPRAVLTAATAAVHDKNGYAPSTGTYALRSACAERLRTDYDLDVTASNIVITQGAAQAIEILLLALLDPGDEVLIPDPSWP